MNINLQMNYWHAFSGNISECAVPLIRYIKALCEPGRVTAKYYTDEKCGNGENNGFLFHTQNTPFGWTCPGWDFNWGWSPAAVPWILHNCFEYYECVKRRYLPNAEGNCRVFQQASCEERRKACNIPLFFT